MTIRRAIDTPVHLQWDPSSRLPLPDPGSAPNNCGPTTIVNIAHFYREISFGIYDTRRLAVSDPYRGTSVNEQAEMLRLRGVPCTIGQPNVFSIHNLVGGGTRPILAGLDMAKVPEYIAGHPFRGKHAIEILQTAYTNNGRTRGFLVRDPNFNRTYRVDPTGGQRFYPDWVIEVSFTNSGMWAVIPDKAKVLPSLPDTSLPASTKADGDPAPMKFRSSLDAGRAKRIELRAGKPIRAGFLTTDRTIAKSDTARGLWEVGFIPKSKLPRAEQVYGNVSIVEFYKESGHVFGYVKQVDLK